MFLIFGTGESEGKTDYVKQACTHCKHSYLHSISIVKSFRLFFVPVLPLDERHILMCPRCGTQFRPNADINRSPLSAVPENTPYHEEGLYEVENGSGGKLIGCILLAFIGLIVCLNLATNWQQRSYRQHPEISDIVIYECPDNSNTSENKALYTSLKVVDVRKNKLKVLFSKNHYFSPDAAGLQQNTEGLVGFQQEVHKLSLEELNALKICTIHRAWRPAKKI